MEVDSDEDAPSQAVILHEDKKYYPEADEVYGSKVEVLVQDEDTMRIDEPIIAPIRKKRWEFLEEKMPDTAYEKEFLVGLMDHQDLVRNIALVGQLHSGKSSFMDMLVQFTHLSDWELMREYRYTDSRVDEQARGLSVKATPMSLVLPDMQDKSYLFNIMDSPGHANFLDEVTAALRLADGCVLVVDAVEGVMLNTRKVVKQALQEEIPIILVINKVDRLILDLKIPPTDAYHKLRHTIEEVNSLIAETAASPEVTTSTSGYTPLRLSPETGNVVFASAKHGWSFTIPSFARIYEDTYGGSLEIDRFSRRLWGDVYFNSKTRGFSSRPTKENAQRTFVEFILEPIYKLYSQVVGEEAAELQPTLEQVGIRLRSSELKYDVKPLLKLVLSSFFDKPSGFVDAVVRHLPTPSQGAPIKVRNTYTGPLDEPIVEAMNACDPRAPLMINGVKMYHKPDCSTFDVLGRVLCGTVRVGDRVRVLGEHYSMENEEDSAVATVSRVWVFETRYRLEVTRIPAGNWVLLEGVDAHVSKTATITALQPFGDTYIFSPLKFGTSAVVKVAIEPLNPSELPKMTDGLRKVNKSYLLCETKSEESGEHVLLGTGELYIDSVLHDLRKMYSEVEIKVADPVVSFCETVVDTSSLKCFAESPNRLNKLTMIAEPLDRGLDRDIENGLIDLEAPKKQTSKFFMEKYDWNLLDARSVWAFAPDGRGPNILADDTLPTEVDKKLLYNVKDAIVHGFDWAVREGPLCEEPIRGVKFKVLDAQVCPDPLERAPGQIIPPARRVCLSSFLMATPRLMEPVYFLEIESPVDCVAKITEVLVRRRGHVVSDLPKPGSPLYVVHAYVPVIDSYGLETDIRLYTQGMAFCMSTFDHWAIVPGDPLDKNIILTPLEASPAPALARDFMVKTRRRKGMSDDVSINKFFDDPMLLELAKQDVELQPYF